MFRRRWKWFGQIVSDEGFSLSFAHKSVIYHDSRGSFEFGYEDGMLSSTPYQIEGEKISLSQADADTIVGRVARGIRWDGAEVSVYGPEGLRDL